MRANGKTVLSDDDVTQRAAVVEALARRLYEARHSPPEHPTWDELDHRKTYKVAKYLQLASVAISFFEARP